MLTGRHWRAWLGWLMLVVFVVVAVMSLDWTRVLQEAAAAHYGWLTLAVLANACILVLAAATWLLFLPKGGRVSPAKVFSIVAVMSTALQWRSLCSPAMPQGFTCYRRAQVWGPPELRPS